jgi:hypothetical protein
MLDGFHDICIYKGRLISELQYPAYIDYVSSLATGVQRPRTPRDHKLPCLRWRDLTGPCTETAAPVERGSPGGARVWTPPCRPKERDGRGLFLLFFWHWKLEETNATGNKSSA